MAYKKAMGGFLVVLLLAVALTGGPTPTIDYVAESCYDDVDNDVDSVQGQYPLIIMDSFDGECIWMPLNFGQGEYDSAGLTDPTSADADVVSYVGQWMQLGADPDWPYPSHLEAVRAMLDVDRGAPSNVCIPDLQNALTAYQNDFGVPDRLTGANAFKAECGVSF